MKACDQCDLKKISLHLKEGHVSTPHKKNFQKSDHVLYNGNIGNIPIVADMTTVAQGISPSVDPSHGAQLEWFNITTSVSLVVGDIVMIVQRSNYVMFEKLIHKEVLLVFF